MDGLDTIEGIKSWIKRVSPDNYYGDVWTALRRIEDEYNKREERIKGLEELEYRVEELLAEPPIWLDGESPRCVYCDSAIGFASHHRDGCVYLLLDKAFKKLHEAIHKEEQHVP